MKQTALSYPGPSTGNVLLRLPRVFMVAAA